MFRDVGDLVLDACEWDFENRDHSQHGEGES